MLVLLIDDHPQVAPLVAQALGDGVTVLHALNGLAGLEVMRTNPRLDLVILDIDMPGLSGYDTCVLIRAQRATLPILPLTMVQPHQHPHLDAYTRDLGCAPVVRKQDAPTALRDQAVAACQQPIIVPPSGLLPHLVRVAAEREAALRHALAAYTVVVFARNPLTAQGLKILIELHGRLVQHIATTTAQLDAHLTTRTVVVATSQAAGLLAAAAVPFPPLVVVADNDMELAQTHAVLAGRAASGTVGVVLLEHAATQLGPLLTAVAAGEAPGWHVAPLPSDAERLLNYLQQTLGHRQLRSDDAHVLLIDLLDAPDRAKATHLGIAQVNTFQQRRSRVYRRLGVRAIETGRQLVRAWLADVGQPVNRPSES